VIQRIVTVQVPEGRHVVIELPPELSVGPAQLEIRVLGESEQAVDIPPPEIGVICGSLTSFVARMVVARVPTSNDKN
jgi:hypothetical protein